MEGTTLKPRLIFLRRNPRTVAAAVEAQFSVILAKDRLKQKRAVAAESNANN